MLVVVERESKTIVTRVSDALQENVEIRKRVAAK